MDGASDLSYKVVSPLRGSLDFGMGSQCLPPQHAQRRCMLGTPGSALGYVVSSLAGLGEDPQGPRRVENARLPPGRRRYKSGAQSCAAHGRREITTNMPMPTGRRQSKIPMGLIETLRFALRDTAAILAALAAATLRAAGNPRRKRQF